MSYATGGLIEATHYNNFINGSNQLNTVWSTGTGNAGYGQSTISAVSIGSTVTATQWATLINALNNTLNHQSGSGSGISAVTAGARIDYLSTLATNINTAYTNRLLYATSGSTTTGSTFSPTATADEGVTYSAYVSERTVTFSSGDAARYFFNAGGRLQFVSISVTNDNGTSRSADAATLLNALDYTFSAADYYALTTSYVTVDTATNTGTYTGDYANLNVKSNGVQGANADTGSIITIGSYLYHEHAGGTNNSLAITYNHRIDIIYPETTYLSNSWGTPTVA